MYYRVSANEASGSAIGSEKWASLVVDEQLLAHCSSVQSRPAGHRDDVSCFGVDFQCKIGGPHTFAASANSQSLRKRGALS